MAGFQAAHPEAGRAFEEVMRGHAEPVDDWKDRMTRQQTGMCEFLCAPARRDAFEAIGSLDEAMLSVEVHIDLRMKVRRAGGSVRFEPSSIVTYVFRCRARPMSAEDWPFSSLRWSIACRERYLDRFVAQWGLRTPPDYAANTKVIYVMRRRQGILIPIVRRAPLPVRDDAPAMRAARAVTFPPAARERMARRAAGPAEAATRGWVRARPSSLRRRGTRSATVPIVPASGRTGSVQASESARISGPGSAVTRTSAAGRDRLGTSAACARAASPDNLLNGASAWRASHRGTDAASTAVARTKPTQNASGETAAPAAPDARRNTREAVRIRPKSSTLPMARNAFCDILSIGIARPAGAAAARIRAGEHETRRPRQHPRTRPHANETMLSFDRARASGRWVEIDEGSPQPVERAAPADQRFRLRIGFQPVAWSSLIRRARQIPTLPFTPPGSTIWSSLRRPRLRKVCRPRASVRMPTDIHS